MRELRKILSDCILNTLNSDQVQQIGQKVDSRFDVFKVSGFGPRIPIPRKVAADSVIQFFQDEDKLVAFFAGMLENEKLKMSGTFVNIRGKDKVLKILDRRGWIYEPRTKSFRKDQTNLFTVDWGFMQEGEEYNLTFASIDIVSNSYLVRNNVRDDIVSTYSRLRNFIQKQIEYRNGRIWFWHGDGGIAAFYSQNDVTRAVIAMAGILSYLPVYNIFENELKPEDEIRLRIGLHYGSAVFKKDISSVVSADIVTAQEVEKSFTDANSIAVTSSVYQFLDQRYKSFFSLRSDSPFGEIYQYNRQKHEAA